MIDTIALILHKNKNRDDFQITQAKNFNPSAEYIFNGNVRLNSRGYAEAWLNPNKKQRDFFKDKTRINYLPRLVLRRYIHKEDGGFRHELKIEFSVPKIIYGHNFNEVDDSDLPKIISNLRLSLSILGVEANDGALYKSTVRVIHPAKNIVLKDFCPSIVIGNLRKANINMHYDIGEQKFRNGGQSMSIHTNHREISFYDKHYDYKQWKTKGEKRSLEKDYEKIDLFSDVPKDFLRYEIRLNGKNSIKNQLNKARVHVAGLTFENLFRRELMRKILLEEWKALEQSMRFNTIKLETPMHLFNKLKFCITSEKTINFKTRLAIIGYLSCINDNTAGGLRELKLITTTDTEKRALGRIEEDLDRLDLEIDCLPEANLQIRYALQDFNILKDIL